MTECGKSMESVPGQTSQMNVRHSFQNITYLVRFGLTEPGDSELNIPIVNVPFPSHHLNNINFR